MRDRLIQLGRRIDRVQKSRWFRIAAIVIIVALTAILIAVMLQRDVFERPTFLVRDINIYTWGAVFLGWWLLVIGLGLTLTYLLITVATTLLALFILVAFSAPGLALAVGGIGTLLFTFVLLIHAVLFLFRYPARVLAVAHTVVKESIRLRISVFFIAVLLLLLPTIPMWVGTEEALRYRIQSFISLSVTTTFYLAACMTIFLSCGTVAFEIRDRQIWQLMTKPLSRVRYLVGKWIGIAAVNLVILIVAGLSIFLFVQYLANQPPANDLDWFAVKNQVLAARTGKLCDLPTIDREVLQRRIDETIENDFELRTAIEQGTRDRITEERRIGRELLKQHSFESRSIPAGEGKRYTFRGLDEARELQQHLELRYQFHYGGDETHDRRPVTMVVYKNGRPFLMQGFNNPNPDHTEYVPTMTRFWLIPWQAIGDAEQWVGTLEILILNGLLTPDGNVFTPPDHILAMNFDHDDFEILYAVGGFEANYFKAMTVMWVKLSFLAMLGIAAATVLSFPVACLMAFTVFLAATMGPYLAHALEQFRVTSGWQVHRIAISAIAHTLVLLFEPFGELKPTRNLVEGRLIPWMQVIKAVLLLGVVWTGITLGLGFLAFRDKELATYSGHG